MTGYFCRRKHFRDCCRNMGPFLYGVEGGKTFCERPFALHRQQAERDKQNVDVAPALEKFLRTPMHRDNCKRVRYFTSLITLRQKKLIFMNPTKVLICSPAKKTTTIGRMYFDRTAGAK